MDEYFHKAFFLEYGTTSFFLLHTVQSRFRYLGLRVAPYLMDFDHIKRKRGRGGLVVLDHLKSRVGDGDGLVMMTPYNSSANFQSSIIIVASYLAK